jgi:hypothetical protein
MWISGNSRHRTFWPHCVGYEEQCKAFTTLTLNSQLCCAPLVDITRVTTESHVRNQYTGVKKMQLPEIWWSKIRISRTIWLELLSLYFWLFKDAFPYIRFKTWKEIRVRLGTVHGQHLDGNNRVAYFKVLSRYSDGTTEVNNKTILPGQPDTRSRTINPKLNLFKHLATYS